MSTDIDHAYRGVPALVLGGSGFIGAWTARALHASGAAVTVAARDTGRAAVALRTIARDVCVLGADLVEATALDALLESARPSIVFNLAGYGVDASERDPVLMAALNARVVEGLCARLSGAMDDGWTGQRLVHAGSALEYGPVLGPLHEDMPLNPTTDYGRTKLQATRAIETRGAMGFRGAVARLFTVYGPGEHPHRLLPALVGTARRGERLALTAGRQPRDFTYVEDVAEGLLRLGASAAAPGTVVNLATGGLTTVREFAVTAATVLGFDPVLLDFSALPERDEEMWHGPVDVSRLRRVLSWIPPTLPADGIRRTWEFRDVG
ncbi:MAG: NAD-dependent epimerase/dehydratase [Acidobacteria bacterium]|nr:NAD-dependent epimerase/dehydratase [Acidobacteriota bacterium]